MSDVHRHHPEATAEEIEMIQIGQLLRATSYTVIAEVRNCRDCGTEFGVTAEMAARPRSKWNTLCASCLAYEF